MYQPRHAFSMVEFQGWLYAAGGSDFQNTEYNTVERYDPVRYASLPRFTLKICQFSRFYYWSFSSSVSNLFSEVYEIQQFSL